MAGSGFLRASSPLTKCALVSRGLKKCAFKPTMSASGSTASAAAPGKKKIEQGDLVEVERIPVTGRKYHLTV